MELLDILVLLVLFVILGIGVYLLYLNVPRDPQPYQDFSLERQGAIDENNLQFYPAMRYRDKSISYHISSACNATKKKDVERALSVLSQNTVLTFYEASQNAEMNILCSEVSPSTEEKGHFIAGEGGPSEIINTSRYAVILSGKVSLYRKTTQCVQPNIAIHEILHALGFDHINDPKSIMYPVTQCDQKIDEIIFDKINQLYSTLSLPDLAIEKVSAINKGPYVDFEIHIANYGLDDSLNSTLIVFTDKKNVKEYSLEKIPIGIKKILKVDNLRIPLQSKGISFEIHFSGEELEKENNLAKIILEGL